MTASGQGGHKRVSKADSDQLHGFQHRALVNTDKTTEVMTLLVDGLGVPPKGST
jgi:hypothetical protein